MRVGRRLGVDVGTVRIGTALSDPDGMLAVPLETVSRGPGDVARLAELVVEHAAVEVVVGLPVSLDGTEGPAAAAVRSFVQGLTAQVTGHAGVPVRLVDERMSTAGAHRALQAAGVDSRRRRAVVDESAAAMILQTALDTERATGSPAGVEVTVASSSTSSTSSPPITPTPRQGRP